MFHQQQLVFFNSCQISTPDIMVANYTIVHTLINDYYLSEKRGWVLELLV
jgi:hypothetical protein